ncbi:MAG TPA: hypothetical protein VH475_17750 [Tepidisphaeraceae bacterium]|jgi:hypothetical protein
MYQALKTGDIAAAKRLIADSPQPVPDLDRRLARLARDYADPQLDFAVLDARETGDAAAAIIGLSQKTGAKSFRSEEWYLVRQAGHWKLLGNFGDYDLPGYGFDKAQLDRYQQLESWVEKRTPELRKELTGCDC